MGIPALQLGASVQRKRSNYEYFKVGIGGDMYEYIYFSNFMLNKIIEKKETLKQRKEVDMNKKCKKCTHKQLLVENRRGVPKLSCGVC